MNKSKKTNKNKTLNKTYKSNKKLKLLILGIMSIVIISVILSFSTDIFNKQEISTTYNIEPKFKKEGVLTFINRENKQKIKTIDIEIAEDEYEITTGLMYRKKMGDNIGMLFIMDEERIQSFWMKKTYISLDIIYLDYDNNIVTIQKYTDPLSEKSIPSYKKAKYVIEVVAGFCDKYKIKEGDSIAFKRNVN